jgi:hypothetical protein
MPIILQVAESMEEEHPLSVDLAVAPPFATAPPIFAFVAAGRGPYGGRHHGTRGGRGGRGSLPNKCSACGGLDHIMSYCTAPDDAFLK